jgi:hypothetical protein
MIIVRGQSNARAHAINGSLAASLEFADGRASIAPSTLRSVSPKYRIAAENKQADENEDGPTSTED